MLKIFIFVFCFLFFTLVKAQQLETLQCDLKVRPKADVLSIKQELKTYKVNGKWKKVIVNDTIWGDYKEEIDIKGFIIIDKNNLKKKPIFLDENKQVIDLSKNYIEDWCLREAFESPY